MRTSLSIAMGLAALVAAPAAAFAQDTSVGGSVSTTTETTTLPPPAPAPAAQPVPATTTTQTTTTTRVADADDGVSDHEKYAVGHLAVGYMGLNAIPIAEANGNAGTINAPVIGVRYWFNERFGLDVGLGLGWTGGSSETKNGDTTTTTDQAARFGLALHGGVPIAFASFKHYKFLVIPEVNLAFARSSVSPTNPDNSDITLSGFQLDLGGRIGGEIHFGFIGVPQLSLQATVGAAFRYQSIGASSDTPSASQSASAWSFGTTVQSDPWALFTNNISALYYFP